MLWRSSTIVGSGIRAKDGSIGSVADLLFDDSDWTVRWIVVDTGEWLPGRQVLLSPACFGPLSGTPQEFPVALTRREVEEGPDLGFDAPVSRQMESRIYSHYGWTPYWGPGPVVAPGATMAAPLPLVDRPMEQKPDADEPSGDPHLRSAQEVTGYYLHAKDGDIGHVEEFLVDDAEWVIRYLVVDTRNWWPGRMVLVSPRWFKDIDWTAQKVHVDLTRRQVETSPDYDPVSAIGRAEEERLHAHYGERPYWV